jgi:homogentisate 1,2-dioxygenase
MVGVTDWGLKKCAKVQPDYNAESWEPLKAHFKRPTPAKIENDLPRNAEGEIGDRGQVPHWTS